jgi:hypothetical protein
MNLNDTTSTAPKGNTSYLGRPGGRIGYDVAGTGPLLVLVPGMGDLRAGYRFLVPALRAACPRPSTRRGQQMTAKAGRRRPHSNRDPA